MINFLKFFKDNNTFLSADLLQHISAFHKGYTYSTLLNLGLVHTYRIVEVGYFLNLFFEKMEGGISTYPDFQ